MHFQDNVRKGIEGRLSAGFNAMVGKPINEGEFYDEAEAMGWHEARVFRAGATLRFESAQQHSRINAVLDEQGVLKSFRCG